MDNCKEFFRGNEENVDIFLFPYEEYPQKSEKVEGIIPILDSLELEVKAKTRPPTYHYWPLSSWQNTKIRVDHIPKSAAACWSIAIRYLLGASGRQHLELYFEDESKSNFCAFITFPDHDYTTKFVEEFNNKLIPGTDMVYQISWAPFYRNPTFDDLPFDEEEPRQDLSAKDEKIKGNPFIFNAGEFIRQLPVDSHLLSKIRAFHQSLKAVINNGAFWGRSIFDRQGVIHGADDGRTTILCFTMVDPCVKQSDMKSIFEQYGECTVNFQDKEGCGLVIFQQRLCAEQAFIDLDTLLEDRNVCVLCWGLNREERESRYKKYGLCGLVRAGCHVDCIKMAESSSSAMPSLHEEKNDGEEKAIAMAETSKRPTGAETRQRPTGAETRQRPTGAGTRQCPTGAGTSKRPTGAETIKRPIGAQMSKRPTGAQMSKHPTGAKTSKHPIGAEASKRPTDAEMSKRPTGAQTSKRSTVGEASKRPTDAPQKGRDHIKVAESSSSAMSPLHGGKNDREKKAVAMEETSKCSTAVETSERPTGAEMSKHFQGVRKSVSKNKRKEGVRCIIDTL